MKITSDVANRKPDGTIEMVDTGLAMREFFALEILKVLLAREDLNEGATHDPVEVAVDYADSLIERIA